MNRGMKMNRNLDMSLIQIPTVLGHVWKIEQHSTIGQFTRRTIFEFAKIKLRQRNSSTRLHFTKIFRESYILKA